MREWSLPLFLLALATPLVAGAEPFQPRINTPQDFHDVLYGVSELQENIQNTACGGWEPTKANLVGQVVGGEIPLPVITDIPGRANSNPLGNPTSGLGVRGAFQYPESAWGFLSSCNINGVGESLPTSLRNSGAIIFQTVNPKKLCQQAYGTATPEKCKELYDDLFKLRTTFPRESDTVCGVTIARKYCFDDPETLCSKGGGCRRTSGPGFSYKRPGESIDPETGACTIIDAEARFTPRSYYRHYGGGDENHLRIAEATVKDPSNHTWKFRVECYGWYQERDPRTNTTYHPTENNGKDWPQDQCEIVIATPDEYEPETPEWKTASGRMQRGIVSSAFPSLLSGSSRSAQGPWALDTATNLSLIDIEKASPPQLHFDDPHDIMSLVTSLIPAYQQASKQTTKVHTDMFDDTGERTIAKWWEAQQKEFLKLTRDPTVKFLLPARFLLGLDPNDPLVRLAQQKVARPNGIVELTVRTGSEELSAILQSFEQLSVLPIRQVRIPVIVPLISENELSSRIAEWEIWKQYQAEGSDAATKAQEVIVKLQEYKTQLQSLRTIRAVLPKYTTKLFDLQGRVRTYLGEWLTENATAFEQYALQSQKRQRLRSLWLRIEQAMNVTAECQLLWCSNQRFTLPVYSLLDNWYRHPDNWGWGKSESLRDLRTLSYTPPKDMEFDFSSMDFTPSEFLIPVLWPVQAKIDIPLPPRTPNDPLPNLPTLPAPTAFSNLQIPTVVLPQKRVIPQPNASDAALLDMAHDDIARGILERIGDRQSLTELQQTDLNWRGSMQGAYCRFPISVVIPPSEDFDVQNTEKIVHIENDLLERMQRLFARWSPNQWEDFLARQARLRRDFPAPKKPDCSNDVVCIDLPEQKKERRSWQWFAPVTPQDFTQILRQLTPAFITNGDEKQNPFLQSMMTLQRLYPDLRVPKDTEILLRSTTP